MVRKRRWADLCAGERAAVVCLGVVQVTLAAIAWIDLARRPRDRVRGRKPLWAAAIGVNFVGPIAYLALGRQAPERLP